MFDFRPKKAVRVFGDDDSDSDANTQPSSKVTSQTSTTASSAAAPISLDSSDDDEPIAPRPPPPKTTAKGNKKTLGPKPAKGACSLKAMTLFLRALPLACNCYALGLYSNKSR